MKKTNAVYFFGIIVAVIFILVYTFADSSANDNYLEKLTKFRAEKDKFFKTSAESPFEDKKKFATLNYFPPNQTYRIKATVETIKDTTRLKLKMTGGEEESFIRYGYASFKLKDQTHKVLLLLKMGEEGEKDGLFLPFTDETSGFDTYGGGRYLDLELEKNGELMIDFNFAYNPFCAYNHNYTCPVPPKENHIAIKINAGEKDYPRDDMDAEKTATK
jgi:uncharacterized protein (DUF1684 family)